MLKRCFDIIFSIIGILLLSPLFIILALCVSLTSPGGVFFRGARIGKNGKLFRIYKFRSMHKGSEGNGAWNISNQDNRLTSIGQLLRNSKLDETAQIFNVFRGDMSFVGPRPELQYYTDMYTEAELPILSIRPGITDYASLVNFYQYNVFSQTDNPDEIYLKYIRPLKLKLQIYYLERCSFGVDVRIMFWTICKIVLRNDRLPKEIRPIVEQYKQDMMAEKISMSE